MGNSSQKSAIVYGVPLEWKKSDSWLRVWFDVDDDIIERYRAPDDTHRGYSIFKLQRRLLPKSARVVIRNYWSSQQATVIETGSRHEARFEFHYLTNRVLTQDHLVDPESVASALENLQTLPGGRLENLINFNVIRFPEELLQPVDKRCSLMDFDADIILVHGLGGNSHMTWTDDERFWPMIWLLDEHNGIKSVLGRFNIHSVPSKDKVRLLTVNHHADMLHIDRDADPYNIAQRLIELLLHAGVGSKPIVWVAHSLGGLIVKEVLFASQTGTQSDIFNSTKGVVFFGTPHWGATWATTVRYRINTRDISALTYLDPTPTIGERAGNGTRLQELNDFFARITIPFLNFSEGAVCSIRIFPLSAYQFDVTIVPDAQARIIGCVTVESPALEEQMGVSVLPSRVHFHCPDRNHLNIARPSDRDHPTYRLTKIYVANWLQRPTAVINNVHHVNWDDFAREIVYTVRMYAVVVERVVDEQRIQTLVSISSATTSALSRMTINDFLVLLALLSGVLITTGVAAVGGGVALGGPLGAAISIIGVGGAVVLAGSLVLRLAPRVKELLTNNSAAIREMINLISTAVIPDFNDIINNAQSDQDLNAAPQLSSIDCSPDNMLCFS